MLGSMRPIEDYVRGWRERAACAEEERRERAAEARALLPLLVRHLVTQCGARRVWLIGSLVEGGFHQRSDLDLVVEGLEGAAIYRAGAELDDLGGGRFRIDLIPLEDAYPALIDKVFRRGELLHEG
jgi:predicted nucleotidyltransferase